MSHERVGLEDKIMKEEITHRRITVYYLDRDKCQECFAGTDLSCVLCSLNICQLFDCSVNHWPFFPCWPPLDVDKFFNLEVPHWMLRGECESWGHWFDRMIDKRRKMQWQPKRTNWKKDNKFIKDCYAHISAASTQIKRYRDIRRIVHGKRIIVNGKILRPDGEEIVGFEETSDGLQCLSRFFGIFQKFKSHVHADIRFSAEWEVQVLSEWLWSAICCWSRCFSNWKRDSRKPIMTIVFSVGRKATTILYDPTTHNLALLDSHAYYRDHGASVSYAFGSNVYNFICHAFETVFVNENKNKYGRIKMRPAAWGGLQKKAVRQTFDLVISDPILKLYEESDEKILPIANIFKMY